MQTCAIAKAIMLFLFCGTQLSLHELYDLFCGWSETTAVSMRTNALAMSEPPWPDIVSGQIAQYP